MERDDIVRDPVRKRSKRSKRKEETAAQRGPRDFAPRDPGPAPTRASLHEAALSYLARGSASASSVKKALERRASSWARRATRAGRDAELVASDAAASRALIPEIVARLREVGLVNDTAYAASRARSMSRAGRSRRAISAHLAHKGVDAATVRESLPHDAGLELTAAIAFARKKRIGPFAREEDAPVERDAKRAAERKALGALARAGFDWNVCERIMKLDRDEADEHLRGRGGLT